MAVWESASQSTAEPLLTGEFRDGPLRGLDYYTVSHRAVTDGAGKFHYRAGEAVTFAVGNLTIGSTVGAPQLTLASLHDGDVGTAEASEHDLMLAATINRARFVQSIGPERDLRSGVSISQAVRDVVNKYAEDISFELDTESFEKSASVRAVFTELGLRFRGAAEARNHLRRALAGIKVLRDERIPTRDGSYLLADVFCPADGGSHPVLMRLGVYGRAFTLGSRFSDADYEASEEREDDWFENDQSEVWDYLRFSESVVSANSSTWVPRGYVLVRVDGRGVGGSPGKLEPFSKQEALDYYDAIGWAAKQPWSDGNIGLYGGSYHATAQWNVAALRPPELKAIAPLASDADAYRDLAYPGGILLEGYRRTWWNESVGKARNPDGDAADFIGGLVDHPWDDEYYHGEGILSADFAGIEIPVLTAVSQTGAIHARAGFEAFAQLPSAAKQLLVVDGNYPYFMYKECQSDLEVFFDRYLKGETPAQEPSPVRMIMRTGGGQFEWRTATAWPIPGTDYRQLFLDAGTAQGLGAIVANPPAQMGVTEYSADVGASADQVSMAVFESAPLDEDIELAGHFRATLWVASTSSDADLFVALRVMDGEREIAYEIRAPESVAPLTWGCLKVSHRALDPDRTTEERPWHTHRREDALLLSPGDVVKTEVEMMAATGRIPAGCRLRIEISPVEGRAAMPSYARAYDESYHRGAVNRVFTGGLLASSISIPVVPRGTGKS